MARLFGTDGVRGVANKELTCQMAFQLGQAAVAFKGRTILIGKDTRLSGDMLESAVAAGIMSMGGTALLAGIIPTPAIALRAALRRRHRHLRLAQPAGVQRHQDLRRPGLQAARLR